MYLCHSENLMPKDTKSLGNNKAPACESRGFVLKKKKVRILTHLLALIAEDLLSMICVFQKKDLSLNPKVRQTNSGQSWTSPTSENRYCFVTYLKF